MLNQQQLTQYAEDGYVILRGAIAEPQIQRLERGFANNPPLDQTLDPNAPTFPAPGRYTLATQSLQDPDLGFIVEHPTIVDGAKQLLQDDIHLTAYVIYDRTPDGPGLRAHHDYKRWRPVGSAMNWLFTIVPFCDFDASTGQLFVAPGSHRLDRVHSGDGNCLEVSPAVKPTAEEFVDPELKRGDLLFMNMHLWHRASANQSSQHRIGLFNKYAAASCPPATGYYLFEDGVAASLSPAGQSLIAVHSDRKLTTTRVMLMRNREQAQIYMQQDEDGKYFLPGGAAWDEQAIPDWDRGNLIAAAQQHLRNDVRIETPWLSYIGDYHEAQGLCRVYGYTLNENGFPVNYAAGTWVDVGDSGELGVQCKFGWEPEVVQQWLKPNITRGKGVSQAQARIDQFAY